MSENIESVENGQQQIDEVQSSQTLADEEILGEEEAAEIAADYLEGLLDIADLDGDIDIEIRENRTYLSVEAEDDESEALELLVGRQGETLDALQELVRLSVLAGTGERSRLILDIAGHRVRREDELKKIAEGAIEAMRSSGVDQHLDPLSPYERKIIHDVVAARGFLSDSEGDGPRRHVVVRVSGEERAEHGGRNSTEKSMTAGSDQGCDEERN